MVSVTVLWIDEAGLLGTKVMRAVFELAEKAEARVVLSGDRRQHGSVERGAALRLLEDEAGLRPAEIKEIQRQKGEYKLAVKALSEGNAITGFERLHRLGWIREVESGDRERALAAAYLETVHAGKTALVVSPTHAEGERLTTEIRRQLKDAGQLGEESRSYTQLVPAHLTLGERMDPASYQPGDVLVFHQNARGVKKGQRLVVGRDPVPLNQAERFGVFRPRTIELAVGDRVRITQNGTTPIGRHRLSNGDLFTVKKFATTGDLVLDNGWTLPRDYGHLAHGQVVTSHQSQGRTVDRVFIGQSSASFGASSLEQFYVSASRGREQALVFTDSTIGLLEAVSRTDERLSATQLVAGLDQDTRHIIRERLAEQARLQPEITAPSRTLEQEAPDHDR